MSETRRFRPFSWTAVEPPDSTQSGHAPASLDHLVDAGED